MKHILILFAHPAFRRSKINAALRRSVEGLKGITFHDLYASYPDFLLDVTHEQQMCEEHDVIIFQSPLYWYSTPAIFKEWMDLVLEHGWAYGAAGNALKGKTTLQAFSAGGDFSTFQREGHNRFTVREITSPFQATANLCQMHWLPPFVVFGVHRGLSESMVTRHAEDYRHAVIALRDGKMDMDKARRQEYLNLDLDSIISKV